MSAWGQHVEQGMEQGRLHGGNGIWKPDRHSEYKALFQAEMVT